MEESPLMLSMVRKKVSLKDPAGLAPGRGDDDRVEGAEPLGELPAGRGMATFISIRHEPMASAVYRQKMGNVDVDETFRPSGASDTSALPMKE